MNTPQPSKRLLQVIRRTPYDGQKALETLDAILVSAVFEVPTSVLFIDDGIWQLVADQLPPSGTKGIARQLEVLLEYDVDSLWVCGPSLAARGLRLEDLCLPVQALDSAAQQQLIANHNIVLND